MVSPLQSGATGGSHELRPDATTDGVGVRRRVRGGLSQVVQVFVDELDCGGALADGRGDPFDGPVPDVAGTAPISRNSAAAGTVSTVPSAVSSPSHSRKAVPPPSTTLGVPADDDVGRHLDLADQVLGHVRWNGHRRTSTARRPG
jgi:hypothetical protein